MVAMLSIKVELWKYLNECQSRVESAEEQLPSPPPEMLPQEALPSEPIYQRPNKSRSDQPSAAAKV